MDERPKCKTRKYKTLRGKQAEHSMTQIKAGFSMSHLQCNENKDKKAFAQQRKL